MPSAKQKRIKRQKKYAQNKDAAKCYMKEYREKKKDSIQLNKQEYYKSNENKITFTVTLSTLQEKRRLQWRPR